MRRRIIWVLLYSCMMLALFSGIAFADGEFGDFNVAGDTANCTWDADKQALTITAAGNYTVSLKEPNTDSDDVIVIAAESGTVNLTLQDIRIKIPEIDDARLAPISITDNCKTTIILSGINNIWSSRYHAAIENKGHSLSIQGDGTLDAYAGAAAIGGAYGEDGSNITVNSGTLHLWGGYYCLRHQGLGGGAGIGGGAGSPNGGNADNITVNGGYISTYNTYGAGIGGGSSTIGVPGSSGNGGNASNITIKGGFVETSADSGSRGYSAVGIGGGHGVGSSGKGGDARNIRITGGEVQLLCGEYAERPIGAGYAPTLPGTAENIVLAPIKGTAINAKCDTFHYQVDPIDLPGSPFDAQTNLTPLVEGYKYFWCKSFDLIVYKITEGAGSTWMQGTGKELRFACTGPYDRFSGVLVDGNTIEESNYTTQPGSTIVTLTADYLETLSVGKHTLRLTYRDGYARTTFTVKAKNSDNNPSTDKDNSQTGKNSNPRTDDNSSPGAWIVILLISGIAVIALGFVNRRRKTE